MLMRKSFARLRRNNRGVATIETMLMLPIIVFTLFYGGHEVWQMLSASLRLDRASNIVASAAARSPIGITEGEITAILNSAGRNAEPSALFARGRVIISAVQGGAGGKVLWQRCKGSLTTWNGNIGGEGAIADLAAAGLIVPTDKAVVIVAETRFQYPIAFARTMFAPVPIRHSAMAIGREAIGSAVVNSGTPSPC